MRQLSRKYYKNLFFFVNFKAFVWSKAFENDLPVATSMCESFMADTTTNNFLLLLLLCSDLCILYPESLKGVIEIFFRTQVFLGFATK